MFYDYGAYFRLGVCLLFENLLEIIAPTRCSSCNDFGPLLCDVCLRKIHRYASQFSCQKCGAPYGELVCTECWDEAFNFSRALALGPFEPPLSRAVVTFKDKNERRLGQYLGRLIGAKICCSFGAWGDVITWVPPSKGALRRRGFDHGKVLAQGVADTLGLPLESFCAHQKRFDLRKLNKQERKIAIEGGFSLKGNAQHIYAKDIVLIDDVMTTGATLNEIARMFLGAGAQEVRVAVVARTW